VEARRSVKMLFCSSCSFDIIIFILGDGKISKVDVIAALADFVPQGMRGVKLFSARAPSAGLGDEDEEDDLHDKWASVGGLEEVKRNLTELIEWPSKVRFS
jgi:SpoVK/Ycf46/Vps4 family AAA+-type ATPase